MTPEEEIAALRRQLVAEQKLNQRTLEVVELVQIRIASLDDEYRRLVPLMDAQEEARLTLVKQLDIAFVENERLRVENGSLRAILGSKQIKSSPLDDNELQLLDELEPE